MIELNKVSYTYPFQDEPAIQDLSFRVTPGEVVLATGASGCGKSTLVRLVNGLCPHFYFGKFEGEIRRKGIIGPEKNLREICTQIGTVFQDPELQFFALNVDDELAFAHEWQGKPREIIQDIVNKTAKRLGITHILSSSIHDLSEGQKQKVALGAVISQNPAVLVLDEPSANLDPESTKELALIIKELKESGMTVLVADHRLYWLEGIADRVLVMDQGTIAVQGRFSILEDINLRQKYGLRSHQVEDVRSALPALPLNGAIEVRDLTFTHKNGKSLYENVNFALPRGITGIIGDNGTGKTTLARLLTGLIRMNHGQIRLNGRPVPPKKILKRTGLIFQNTDHQLHMNSVLRELAMASGQLPPTPGDKKELMTTLDQFGLIYLAHRHPQSLSGGEKQRLVIACGLASKPDILILDEPTSGLDGGNMRRISKILRKAADDGVRVIVITHDLELLARICDAALRLPLFPPSQGAGS